MDAINTRFANFAAGLAKWSGSPLVFTVALALVVIWAACGPFFEYSEEWMLVVNTMTTIVTFLMVFVIQNSQNRDGLAVQIKLDEIIRANHGAKNAMINLEELPQAELDKLRIKFAEMAVKALKPPRSVKSKNLSQITKSLPTKTYQLIFG